MDKYIKAPITEEDAKTLRAGDYVYLSGTIYTARVIILSILRIK